ncbi:tetratricopeptide repeat protein 33 isoform X2 [Micropterus dolomieu]|uniref:tetratricopeptide repeat protein 33 isoform X2 n=1 Tax=Micropterus dolomieu TaxID=147949 RepID=UPI001E8ECE2A|nr:tetratricopeptide repeat protein 33 isoform X2 [Micropterus dolomieu]
MASFGWKRKVGEKVLKSVVQQFEAEAEKADDDGPSQDEDVDWLHAIKRRREVLLEDCAAKSKRLKDEGALLAEQGSDHSAGSVPCCEGSGDGSEVPPPLVGGLADSGPCPAQPGRGGPVLSLQAVKSFQVAIHLCPSDRTLWQEDLAWACRLQKQHLATMEKIRQEEETKKQILNAPELEQDYDFESDEVLAACEAVAERQMRYEELKRTAVVIDAEGNIKNVVTGEGGSEDTATPSKEQFVKARGL